MWTSIMNLLHHVLLLNLKEHKLFLMFYFSFTCGLVRILVSLHASTWSICKQANDHDLLTHHISKWFNCVFLPMFSMLIIRPCHDIHVFPYVILVQRCSSSTLFMGMLFFFSKWHIISKMNLNTSFAKLDVKGSQH